MRPRFLAAAAFALISVTLPVAAQRAQPVKLYEADLDLTPGPMASDKSIRYDYDLVYVRSPRTGDEVNSRWAEIAHPALMDPGADLMLLHPNGTEELLVAGGEDGAITDPVISFDGEWVFYSHVKGLKGTSMHGKFPTGGADIYKLHLATRKTVRLTHQEYTPNTGAADWASDFRSNEKGKTRLEYGVLNLGAYPLPGGRLVFTSNRDGFVPPRHPSPCLQLFTMDDDGKNVEKIGHMNLGMALHPVVLADGRIMFSSLESQGLRSNILWGLWHINPDGTYWGPLYSAFLPGGAPDAFHFQTQLSDGSIVAEQYYNANNNGFGSYHKIPAAPPEGQLAFGPGWRKDPRNPPLRFGRFYNAKPKEQRLPFTPAGAESFTPFVVVSDAPSDPSVFHDEKSPRVGKFTHPSGAPDNHMLTVWSPGPVNHQNGLKLPSPDAGIYLIAGGKPVQEPAELRLIKNDPRYNEQWPRAVVPYRRIHGVDEPARLEPLANDGSLHRDLPEGTPFGLVGSSSFYKRETYPNGRVFEGEVTARYSGEPDRNGFEDHEPFNTSENASSMNWTNQGADAGRYSNEDIHAVRIIAMEATTHRHRGNYPKDGRQFASHATERLRILGEIPLRKYENGVQPLDPDGNPDTSFLAKIPADTAFTFQTVDKDGMVLNMAQTWHQLRPGETRMDCGGCHAHSQVPTDISLTAAGREDYKVWDLTAKTPLLVTRTNPGTFEKQWDEGNSLDIVLAETPVVNVEYFRDIRPILDRSCVACHTKTKDKPAGNLVLDADDEEVRIPNRGAYPGTYYRLAMDGKAQFGHKPVIHNGSWRQSNASRYIRKFQSRRSLLAWKILGRRTDGWHNDDFPTAQTPGDPGTLELKGEAVEDTRQNRNRSDLDYNGKQMPPEKAVAEGKVKPLSDRDKRTLIRWIDLGCPIDFDEKWGWHADDQRPTLTLTKPLRGENAPLEKIVVGMYDYAGLDEDSFSVTADFEIDGAKPGAELAAKFVRSAEGVRSYELARPLDELNSGVITVSVKDRAGNITRIERSVAVGGR